MRNGPLLLVLALAAAAGLAHAEPTPAPKVLAPGWTALGYAAPAPGTYELPPLGEAADGDVLDTAGRPRRLHDFLGDKVVVLSFVYRSCPDVNGCPLANFVLTGIERRVLEDPALRDEVRLVSMSFDPAHDPPASMRQYGAALASKGSDWAFLTSASEQALTPILEAYGQSVRREYDENGRPLGTISHILRVYLIDKRKRIRNIYSSSFLHADTMTSDIQTVLREDHRDAGRRGGELAGGAAGVPSAGDDKRGYERDDYETRSHSVATEIGTPTNLMRFQINPPLGLPKVPVPKDNPVTVEKVALGRRLFFDRRLSRNNTISCAMCHIPDQGFTSNEIATAVGIEGQTVRRNAPTIYNAAYARLLFHDGRETRLEQQIWGPILARNEMGDPAVGYVLDKIRALPDYRGRFEAAFGGRGLTMETLGMALASYERTLLSANSPFDRWHFRKDRGAVSASAARGFQLFTGKAGCAHCHTIAENYALFTDQQLHNTGVGYRQTMASTPRQRRVQLAPGTFVTMDTAVVADASEPPPSDLGRYEISEDPNDRWKYKTPGLRNVGLTAPYMHDGSLATLREVVDFYDAGGAPNELLDPAIRPLHLSDPEKDDLVAFLESLTGSNVGDIVADGLAAPVGDPG
ncbi:MAG: cytochrome c peroxidase [Candidatus Binatia bacterium]